MEVTWSLKAANPKIRQVAGAFDMRLIRENAVTAMTLNENAHPDVFSGMANPLLGGGQFWEANELSCLEPMVRRSCGCSGLLTLCLLRGFRG